MNPKPQGSKNIYNGIPVEACKLLPQWRALVTRTACELHQDVFHGPIALSLVFLFERPKSHYNRAQNPTLLADAPSHHTCRPDLSKLTRAVEDALVDAGLLRDDSIICVSSQAKRYVRNNENPGCIISLSSAN